MLLRKAVILAVVSTALAVLRVESSGNAASIHSTSPATSRPNSTRSLPESLAPVLREVKAKSRAPVLLPSELPEPFATAKHAVVEKAAADEYAISLYYELEIGDAGFAALFAAQTNPKYHPQDLGNVRRVELSRGIRGFFRPVSCGGSCAAANLWWEQSGVLYQIQLKLSSSLSEDDQQNAIAATANSSILAGPR